MQVECGANLKFKESRTTLHQMQHHFSFQQILLLAP